VVALRELCESDADGSFRAKYEVIGRLGDGLLVEVSGPMQKERLNGFVLGDVGELETYYDPVAAPIREAPMKISFRQSDGGAQHVVVEEQTDCTEQIRLPGAIFADDGIDALFENDVRPIEIAVVDELKF
jgi:hypothetical protein